MRVIGTAGHVDHGKSTLIAALTGIHPDRLKEEREREMTIDLGFAWWELPNGEEVGVVDVPGHRDFIGNMLAGIGGIDAVLLVVAADEGVMPQTREHLAILDLLQISSGVVALTKMDAPTEPGWQDLVEQDVRRTLEGTALSGAEIVRVSAKTGEGLDKLQASLERVLSQSPERVDLGRPRLPIDRVFTMAGFGTVVTGTLTDGSLEVGEEVEIVPPGLRGRVRGLQTHKRKEERAVPGSRTAVNVSGLDVEEIERGQVLARPNTFEPTRRLDVHFRMLPEASLGLKHDDEVKLYLGSAEVVARARLLGAETLEAGQRGWLQLELSQPVVAARGDRYVLRRPSPGETLGGGQVLDALPKGRHKRFSEEVLTRLEALVEGTPGDILLQTMATLKVASAGEVKKASHLEDGVASQAIRELLKGKRLALLSGEIEDGLLATPAAWESIRKQLVGEVEGYHEVHPLRRGMPREELKSRSNLAARAFNGVFAKMVSEEDLKEEGHLILRPGHVIRFDPQQQDAVESLLKRFAETPYAPPTVKECREEVGEEIFQALLDLGELVLISSEVVFRRADLDAMVDNVRHFIETRGSISVAQLRDEYHTSRRYALALLEYMDGKGVTVREGDVRRLGSA